MAHAMYGPMNDEDRELDALWREKFGEPLPIIGGPDIVRTVLGLPPKLAGHAGPNQRGSAPFAQLQGGDGSQGD